MTQVFISYSQQDQDIVARVYTFLSKHGVDVWQDKHSIRVGEPFDERIKAAIEAAGFVVFLVSANALASEYVIWEVRYALELRVRGVPVTVIPVLIDDSKVPDFLSQSHVLQLTNFEDEELGSLLLAIHNERVRILFENEFLRITAVRQGSSFDDEIQHPVQTSVLVSRAMIFVTLMQSLGPQLQATQVTRNLKAAVEFFFRNMSELLKGEEAKNPSVLFRKFFQLLNDVHRELLTKIEASGAVLSDLALAMIADGHIYMRNAGASCGLVKQLLGVQNESEESWVVQAMTGNVGGELSTKDLFSGNVFAYPIGRFSRITDADPMAFAFTTPRSVAALANFKLLETEAEELNKTAVALDALGLARRLVKMRRGRQAVGTDSSLDSMVVTIERLKASETFLSDAEEQVARRAQAAARSGLEPRSALMEAPESAEAHAERGRRALEGGDTDAALKSLQAALACYEQAGNEAGAARSLMAIGSVKNRQGEQEEAVLYLERALSIAERIKHLDLQAMIFTSLGGMQRQLGHVEKAMELYTRALLILRPRHDKHATGVLLNNLGMAHSEMGESERALRCFRDAMRALEAVDYPAEHAMSESNAAWILHNHLGRSAEAAELWQRAIETLREHQIAQTADNASIVQLQIWREEAEGTRRTEEELEQVIAEVFELVKAGREQSRAILERTVGRLLTGLAEAVVEQMLFNPDLSHREDQLKATLELLRRVRDVGIEVAYGPSS